MPFLRFSRDRRGYESTFLLQAARRRGDKDASALLYWFRTPPHIKIGRAAFDEDTVRTLEDEHPEVEFDWARILAARPLPPEPVEAARLPRKSGRRPDSRFSALPARPAPPVAQRPFVSAPVLDQGAEAPPIAPPPVALVPATLAPREEPPVQALETSAEQTLEPEPPAETVTPARRFVRVFDAESQTDEEEKGRPEPEPRPHPLSDPSAAERAMGSEQLSRLRGQHAAALARISSRIPDPVLADTLRTLADRANPDAWVTDTEVREGLAGLADVYTELARHIGRRRRRRRRGGRGTGAASPGAAAEGASELEEPSEPGDGSEPEEESDESDGPGD